MGKGGTKFCGDAISARGKGKSGSSTKDIRKNMEKFKETGQHPELERLQHATNSQIPALPDFDPHRQFVFLDISIAAKPLGRLVIELFDDIVPAAANHFRNRCMPGSSAGLAGAHFHKLLPHYAIHGGLNPRASDGMRLQPFARLRAVEAGTVSISLSGDEFVIALARALDLDRTHQVVGRVTHGKDLLEELADLRTGADDCPLHRVVVSKAGATNHKGQHEDLDDAAGQGPPKDMATRLAEASAEARSSVMEALEVGLGHKRKADAPAGAGPSGWQAPGQGAAGAGVGPGAGPRNVKSKMMDAMLGSLSSSGDDDGDDDSEEKEEEAEQEREGSGSKGEGGGEQQAPGQEGD